MIAMANTPTVLIVDDELGPRESLRFLLKNLEQSAVFKDVEEGNTVRDREGRYRFSLTCALERPEA